MADPIVSIIIPTYNSEQYVDDIFKSIKEIKNAEIIIIDDGSKDQTVKKIQANRSQLSSSQNFYLIPHEHNGPSVSRNIGIQQAKGKYVVFVDSDDLVDSKVLNRICALNLNYDITSFSNEPDIKVIESDDDKFDLISKVILNSGIPSFIAGPCSKLYKREFLLNNNLLFNPLLHNGEDLLFNIAAIARAGSVLLDTPSFYHVRLSPNSITRGTDNRFLENSQSFVSTSSGVIDDITETLPSISSSQIDVLQRLTKEKSLMEDTSYALRHSYTINQIW